MIFKPELCEKILRGEKTQTRRLVQCERHGFGERGWGIEEVLMIQWPERDYEMDGPEYEKWRGDGVYVWQWDYPEDTWQMPADFDADIVRAKWIIGRTYAIQPGRGKKAIGRFRLLSIRREFLQDISGEDAQAEGVSHTAHNPPTQPCPNCAQAAFPELWDSINTKPGTRYQDNPEVWVLEFEVV